MQVEPLLGLGQQIQYVDGRHILLESCLQQSQLRWILLAVEPLDDQTVVADPYELVLGKAAVYLLARRRHLRLELCTKIRTILGQRGDIALAEIGRANV